jgi:anaerobic selenocysteine-containing dehydrogenase
MPIRGHSNVQGMGSVGVTPALKQAMLERFERRLGIAVPTSPGLDTMACMEAADRGEMDAALCLGGNLYGSNPDAAFAHRALSRVGCVAYLTTTLNTGHAWGRGRETLVLPVLPRDEEPQPTTQESMFNFVRLSDGGPPRHEGPKSEVEVIAKLADAVLGSVGPVNWYTMGDHRQIREWIAQVVPGFEKINRIDDTKEEFQIGGRTFHSPKFATANGRAKLHVHTLPELRGRDGELRLMTVRSEGQFNTVVYEEEDIYRGQDRRDVILMHPDDVERFGLSPDQRVSVFNDTGRLDNILVRAFNKIKPGNALMYYPEANVLVPRTADPFSRTPAFKGVVVKVESATATSTRPQEAVVDSAR